MLSSENDALEKKLAREAERAGKSKGDSKALSELRASLEATEAEAEASRAQFEAERSRFRERLSKAQLDLEALRARSVEEEEALVRKGRALAEAEAAAESSSNRGAGDEADDAATLRVELSRAQAEAASLAAAHAAEKDRARAALERAERRASASEAARQADSLDRRNAELRARSAAEAAVKEARREEREAAAAVEAECATLREQLEEAGRAIKAAEAAAARASAEAADAQRAAEEAERALAEERAATEDDFGAFAPGDTEEDVVGSPQAAQAAALAVGKEWLASQRDALRDERGEIAAEREAVAAARATAVAAAEVAEAELLRVQQREAGLRQQTLEVASIATRLAEKEEELAVESARAAELRRRLARLGAGGEAGEVEEGDGGAMEGEVDEGEGEGREKPPADEGGPPTDGGRAAAHPSSRLEELQRSAHEVERVLLDGITCETVLALEIQTLERDLGRVAMAPRSGTDSTVPTPLRTPMRAMAATVASSADKLDEMASATTPTPAPASATATPAPRAVDDLGFNPFARDGSRELEAALSAKDDELERELSRMRAEKARDLLLAKQRYRTLLMQREGELRRAQTMLNALRNGEAASPRAATAWGRPQSPPNTGEMLRWSEQPAGATPGAPMFTTAAAAAAAAAPVGADETTSAAAPPPGDSGVTGLMTTAREQARLSREVELARSRVASLEARLKGATNARKEWAHREAELIERVAERDRMLQAQERVQANLAYLRNTVLKAAEGGGDGFLQAFPVISSFLEFSPSELARVEAAQNSLPSANNLWGYYGAAPPPPVTSSITSVAPPVNVHLTSTPELPGTKTKDRTGGEAAAEANAKGESKRLARMKQLLLAAEQELGKAHAEINRLQSEVKALKTC